jgi:hypothetical protein
MRLHRNLIWIPLAVAGALVAATSVSQADIYIGPAPAPAPYGYYGPNPYFYEPGLSDGPGSCYYDSLYGRVCRD